MRTKTEIRLLMVRQRIRDAIRSVLAEQVVDIETYRCLQAKFNATQYYLIKLRKKQLKVRKSVS